MPAEPAPNCHSDSFRRVRPEEALARLGLRQHRQVTTKQLNDAGWDSSFICKQVDRRRLHPTFFQVYSLGGPARTDRELWMAATLSFGDGTRLAAAAAAELCGWLRFPTGLIHVQTPTERKPREGITPIFHERRGRWRYVDFIPVTGPEQTILDCATVLDSDKAFRRVVRQAQVDGLTTHSRLLVFAEINCGARGVARLKRELAEGPSRTRSANEDDVLELFRSGEQPETNYLLGGDEWDLAFPAQRVLVEVQGPPHDNPTARADDIAKQRRGEALGYTVRWIS